MYRVLYPGRHKLFTSCIKRNIGMIDGHCHLSAEEFEDDRNILISDAKNAGVKGIVVVSEFQKNFEDVISLSNQYPDFIYPCLGLHPIQIGNKSVTLEEYEACKDVILEHRSLLRGIGEIGLDFTPRYIKTPEDKVIQKEVFRKQISLAKEFDLPVNVHSRSAGRPVINLLIEEGANKVLLHAFDGKPSVAMQGVEAGFFFSIPPSIIRSEQKQKLVSKIPLSNLLLETDAPALGPEMQVRNTPANIRISCEEIARIKGVSFETVMEDTMKNAQKLFGLLS